ncbi:hypothetical protein J6590_010551 [Homalodisca vitripennis]|nr:hypothetical protein J6590_010551 [Homalodisca vitripennis]
MSHIHCFSGGNSRPITTINYGMFAVIPTLAKSERTIILAFSVGRDLAARSPAAVVRLGLVRCAPVVQSEQVTGNCAAPASCKVKGINHRTRHTVTEGIVQIKERVKLIVCCCEQRKLSITAVPASRIIVLHCFRGFIASVAHPITRANIARNPVYDPF